MNTEYLKKAVQNITATRCACCNRKLKDASSVEFGIGPVCRRKYQYEDAPTITQTMQDKSFALCKLELHPDVSNDVWLCIQKNNSRGACNLLVKWIAAHQLNEESLPAISLLRILSYEKLAERVERRLTCNLHVEKRYDDYYEVKVAYNSEYIDMVKRIKGRKYDPQKKAWRVPAAQKKALWEVLIECFSGTMADGPKGKFLIQG
jgi:hypothetical protein